MHASAGKTKGDGAPGGGPILAQGTGLEVIRGERSTLLLDAKGGLSLELATARPLELLEQSDPADGHGVLAAFGAKGSEGVVTVKYLTPTLSVFGEGLEVDLVEEVPREPEPGVLSLAFAPWWWWPLWNDCCECCCADAVLDPCQCELVVQKRRGWCLFDRPVTRLRGLFLWIYFGWPAEQVTSLTFCRTGCDPKQPIERQTEVETHFDPPLPDDFGDVRCQRFHPHRSIC